MDENEIKRTVRMHCFIAAILSFVCVWDIFILNVSGWTYYYPVKIIAIGTNLAVAYYVAKRKITPNVGYEISSFVFYTYSYLGTLYLHPTYLFSFFEGFTIICLVYTGPPLRFSSFTIYGLILAIISIENMPEPLFIKTGHSIRPDLQLVTCIFGVLTFFTYWFFNRQRSIIYNLDQRFSTIGRQSAFLLHELKSPLSRFMAGNSDKDNRDAEYIYSIIEGVELLVTKKENLSLMTFSWSEIKTYLEHEFSEACEHYKLHLELSGLEGEGFGHKSTIKLALKNLIKNAVESFAKDGSRGHIKVIREGGVIEVSNNGSIISEEKLEQLFTPFYSDKKTKNNYGIGLHFVDSVVKAHDGEIRVHIEDGWNVFRIKLGGAG